MAQTSVIQVRVDAELKKEAENLFNEMGLDISSAMRLFLKQAIIHNGIPFALKRPGTFFDNMKGETIGLNEAEWKKLTAALENPPRANKKLKGLIRKHRA
jgi:addiction module RelB/DinJ family antitoxin